MQIESIKDLKKLLELCQEQGVDSIKIDNLEIKLGTKPVRQKQTNVRSEDATPRAANDPFSFENVAIKYQTTQDETADKVETAEPTEEELLFWSVSEDPQP